MTFGALAGYIASVLVFATFCMKTIVPLRIVAIASNVFFVLYGFMENLLPVILLHIFLLPLNIIRLIQLQTSAHEIEEAFEENFSPNSILPLMHEEDMTAGQTVFRIGEDADAVYLVGEGSVLISELGITLGPGEVFGEIGLFSDSGIRTASAVMHEDGLLYRLSRKALAGALVQHPRMGVHLLRLITRRLMQNSNSDSPAIPPAPATNEDKPLQPSLRTKRPRKRPSNRLAIIGLTALALLVGALSFAPTAYWLLSRDAAVTTWVNDATSSIKGNIVTPLPLPGSVVGANGHIVEVADDQAERGDVLRAEAAVEGAQAEVRTLEVYVAVINETGAAWDQRAAQYAAAFVKKLEVNAAGLKNEIGALSDHLALAKKSAERSGKLSTRGYASNAEEELAQQKVLDLTEALAAKTKALSEIELRLEQASEGVYFDEFGRNPDWAFQSMDRIKLAQEEAHERLRHANAQLQQARLDLEAAEQSFIDQSRTTVRAPAGSIIWSRIAGEGAAVTPGVSIVSWIDCDDLLVDVPASDIMVSRLREGGKAEVTLEGERKARDAQIVLRRGAAATLGADDLAAVASGHDDTTAQVLLKLSDESDMGPCPVGRAASIDFVDVSFFDLVVAFLRL